MVGTTPTSNPSSLACRLHRRNCDKDRMTGTCCCDPELPLERDEYCLHSSFTGVEGSAEPVLPFNANPLWLAGGVAWDCLAAPDGVVVP